MTGYNYTEIIQVIIKADKKELYSQVDCTSNTISPMLIFTSRAKKEKGIRLIVLQFQPVKSITDNIKWMIQIADV